MSLTLQERNELRKLKSVWSYAINEDGNPMYPNDFEEKPNYEIGKLRRMIFEQIEKLGYTINQTNPKQANCIIRVYNDEKEYEDGKYRILGMHCYLKNQTGQWKCIDRMGTEFEIDFSKHVIRIWFFQDEYWDVSVDFFDTYVKLVKEK